LEPGNGRNLGRPRGRCNPGQFSTELLDPGNLRRRIVIGAAAAAVRTVHRCVPLSVDGYEKIIGKSIEGGIS